MTIQLLQGDNRVILPTLAERSIQCCVTSPPYFGLRRYDVDGAQIGLEQTPAEYVAALVEVFRQVRRVLRDDGVLWVNLGDSYNSPPVGTFNGGGFKDTSARTGARDMSGVATSGMLNKQAASGLPPKNLLGIPWRVAFALQDDGWILRSDIIWSKPNPMPESVTDRPTRAHEYLFLFAKQARYFYDAEAVREPLSEQSIYCMTTGATRKSTTVGASGSAADGNVNKVGKNYGASINPAGRNRRTVWAAPSQDDDRAAFGFYLANLAQRLIDAGVDAATIGAAMRQAEADNREAYAQRSDVFTVSTRPYKEAHFATFPEQLIEPCILAGSAAQACEHCGAPWERVVERERLAPAAPSGWRENGRWDTDGRGSGDLNRTITHTLGFRPTCRCSNTGAARSVVLDPFVGSGTTCRVAEKYGRDSIGIDLGYSELQEKRTDGVQKVMLEVL